MAAFLLAGSIEAFSPPAGIRACTRAMSPQMQLSERYNPQFGDNTYARRSTLSDPNGVEATEVGDAQRNWYYSETPKASDQLEPQFGDNTYARRSTLSDPKGVVVPTGNAQRNWYYSETPKASDQFEPQFGDNTYARRSELSSR